MDLSIIIINWNSDRYLTACLRSIYKQVIDIQFEVIVVDNASQNPCGDMVRNDFPAVRFIQSAYNLGFSGGNNLGFSHSNGTVLLFLNPDTEILGNALMDLYSVLVSSSRFGAIGGKLLNSDLTLQTSCILPFPTILNQIFDVEMLKLNFPSVNFWGIKPLFWHSNSAAQVDALSGACLMVKRHVFDKVNLFCTDYFMYSEDVDLCFNIKRAGYKVLYLEQAQIVHHGGGSSKQAREKHFNSIMMRESTCTFLRKNHSQSYALVYRCSVLCVSLFRMTLFAIALPVFGSTSLVKWFKLLRWSLGLEQWANTLQHKTAV